MIWEQTSMMMMMMMMMKGREGKVSGSGGI
jgi:hypothetical protein